MKVRLLAIVLGGAVLFGSSHTAAPSFTNVSAKAGVGGGARASWGDINGDTYPDLVLSGQVFLNQGNGTFKDITQTSGVAGNPGYGALIADFNNDGNADIYFFGGPGALYLGDGKGRFEKGSSDPNPHGRAEGCAAADIDNDGWIDVYIANHEVWQQEKTWPFPDVILKNDKGKLKRHWEAPPEKRLAGRGVTFCDFDEDKDMDAYVSNYRLAPNFLWVNNGRGEFTDEAMERGCAGTLKKNVGPVQTGHGLKVATMGHTIGSLWADFDNDGFFDIFVGNFSHPPVWQDRPQLFRNTGKSGGYKFQDVSAKAGIPWQESYASVAAGDFNNDGRIDFYFTTVYPKDTSRLFQNMGDMKFSDVTKQAGTNSALTYQAAWADYDNDGRLDLMAGGNLFRNTTDGGKWLKVILEGTHCNRSAIGARAKVEAGLTVVRQVECGTGSGNQNDLALHFGLGDKEKVEVQIVWPCGATQTETGKAGEILKIKEKKQ